MEAPRASWQPIVAIAANRTGCPCAARPGHAARILWVSISRDEFVRANQPSCPRGPSRSFEGRSRAVFRSSTRLRQLPRIERARGSRPGRRESESELRGAARHGGRYTLHRGEIGLLPPPSTAPGHTLPDAARSSQEVRRRAYIARGGPLPAPPCCQPFISP